MMARTSGSSSTSSSSSVISATISSLDSRKDGRANEANPGATVLMMALVRKEVRLLEFVVGFSFIALVEVGVEESLEPYDVAGSVLGSSWVDWCRREGFMIIVVGSLAGSGMEDGGFLTGSNRTEGSFCGGMVSVVLFASIASLVSVLQLSLSCDSSDSDRGFSLNACLQEKNI